LCISCDKNLEEFLIFNMASELRLFDEKIGKDLELKSL
jgi:hypothetical protein